MLENQKVPHICLIIVNWNNYKDTIACLESVFESSLKNNIVVIDNGSDDSSVQKISQWANEKKIKYRLISRYHETNISIGANDVILTLISLNENRGFAAANNEGIRFAVRQNENFVLLLNNDTIIEKDLFMKLSKTVQDVKNVGIIGCKIKHFKPADRIWFSGGRIDFIRGSFYHHEDDCREERDTDFVTGCLMLIPTDIFKAVGYFDERYFLNVEDVDFSYRVKEAGFRLVINCNAEIYHKVSSSIGGLHSARNQYYFHRNRLIYFNKHLTGLGKIIFNSFQVMIAIPAWILIQLVRCNTQSLKGALFGYLDYLKGNFGKSKYF